MVLHTIFGCKRALLHDGLRLVFYNILLNVHLVKWEMLYVTIMLTDFEKGGSLFDLYVLFTII